MPQCTFYFILNFHLSDEAGKNKTKNLQLITANSGIVDVIFNVPPTGENFPSFRDNFVACVVSSFPSSSPSPLLPFSLPLLALPFFAHSQKDVFEIICTGRILTAHYTQCRIVSRLRQTVSHTLHHYITSQPPLESKQCFNYSLKFITESWQFPLQSEHVRFLTPGLLKNSRLNLINTRQVIKTPITEATQTLKFTFTVHQH